jgi:hypothetical protein
VNEAGKRLLAEPLRRLGSLLIHLGRPQGLVEDREHEVRV